MLFFSKTNRIRILTTLSYMKIEKKDSISEGQRVSSFSPFHTTEPKKRQHHARDPSSEYDNYPRVTIFFEIMRTQKTNKKVPISLIVLNKRFKSFFFFNRISFMPHRPSKNLPDQAKPKVCQIHDGHFLPFFFLIFALFFPYFL